MDKNALSKLQLLDELGYDLYELKGSTSKSSVEVANTNQNDKGNLEVQAESQTIEEKISSSPVQLSQQTSQNFSQSKAKINSIPALNFDELSEQIKSCRACDLHKNRIQAVVGFGDNQSDLFIVGEAPGQMEDELGEPFVGRSGKLLDAILFAVDLNRRQVYIANMVKCRPPNNRNPEAEEVNTCEHFLHQQIAFIKPKLIVSLGAVSSQNLLKTNEPMGRLRGKKHFIEINYNQQIIRLPLIASYHPAYLLRDPNQKSKAWQDWKMIRDTIF